MAWSTLHFPRRLRSKTNENSLVLQKAAINKLSVNLFPDSFISGAQFLLTIFSFFGINVKELRFTVLTAIQAVCIAVGGNAGQLCFCNSLLKMIFIWYPPLQNFIWRTAVKAVVRPVVIIIYNGRQ